MRKLILILIILLYAASSVWAQAPVPPPVKNKFKKLTSYNELTSYVRLLEKGSPLLKVEVLGQSVKGRNLYALKFSSGIFGKDTSKIRVLIVAQQHGNEQSGKEGALLLASELLKSENRYLFNKIDLVLIPQVNPDGAEVNKRLNANKMDLNRNHLIMTEPEVMALHKLFDNYLFEVTLDVHEYSPYGAAWERFGYRKNSEITLGSTTNINVSENIRNLSNADCLPFIFKFLEKRNFSCFTYCPGSPPGEGYIRHSTFDVNDGRQSFGIQNTFSFIQEGMNGIDDSIANLKKRAEGQMTGMRGMLEYVYGNTEKIKTLVASEREKLLNPAPKEKISIQSEHTEDFTTLKLPLFSYSTGNDTVYVVKDYKPLVRSLYDVEKPLGYLIPKDCTILVDWVVRQALVQETLKMAPDDKVMQYGIAAIDSIDFEGDVIVDPKITSSEVKELAEKPGYLFIPAAQMKGNLLILALEPKSMLGLVTYKQFAPILKKGKPFPVLRVVR